MYRVLDVPGQARRRERQVNPLLHSNAEKRRGGRKAANSPMPRCRENPLGRLMGDRTANRHR